MTDAKITGDVKIAAGQSLKERKYWLNKISGEIIKSNFPYDYTGNEHALPGYETVDFMITEELLSRLTALSKNSDYTLHIILVTELTILLYKYTEHRDILLGAPIDRQESEGDFLNTVIVLRNQVEAGITFKELLIKVRQTVIEASEHQNYPLKSLLFDLGMEFSANEFPLFDVAVLLENIQDPSYISHIRTGITFAFLRTPDAVRGRIDFDPSRYKRDSVKRFAAAFLTLLTNTLFNVDIPVDDVTLLTETEKHQLLNEFNNTGVGYSSRTAIQELFLQQVSKTPDNIAISYAVDVSEIYEELNRERTGPDCLEKLGSACFRANKFIFNAPLDRFDPDNPFIFLKSQRHDIVVVNENVVRLLELCDGKNNLLSLYEVLHGTPFKFLIYTISIDDVLEISYQYGRKEEITLGNRFDDFARLCKALYRSNLIELVDIDLQRTVFPEPLAGQFDAHDRLEKSHLLEDLFQYKRNLSEAEVLLLGDTPGQSTAGLLYMASYLTRNNIKAYALFNHSSWHSALLKEQVEGLLTIVKPKVVGVSMKWFLHMSRVIEICKIVKEYARTHSVDIKVVVGGNSASFFYEDIFKNQCIDYLVRGDGELPLLKICRGEEPASIPNIVYRKNGEPVANPITYVQDTSNSADIYLSHMDDILLSDYSCIFGIFFIFTQKGCQKNCHYCGGCNDAQRKAFNRAGLSRRNEAEVRKDIIESQKYASTIYFLWDEYSNERLMEHCKKIWEGIDLSNHFGFLSNVIPPSPELIEYSCKVFKYVYWNIDMASMSDRHRQQLLKANMVKYQPTDQEVLAMFNECEKYGNNEILINIITGLPFFNEEDIEASERMETHIMDNYSCFGEFFWARLHAEPGAPVIQKADAYGMYSLAYTFDDFHRFSQKNFHENEIYPNVDNYDYPFIYFKDEKLNSKISRYYSETSIKTQQYHAKQKRKLHVYYKKVTYRELDRHSDKIASLLRAKGIVPGTTVGIMAERSIEMVSGLLGILKAGGAYLPIDPQYPVERIHYILEDSRTVVLLNQRSLIDTVNFGGEIITLEKTDPALEGAKEIQNINLPTDPAYIIFTSGSTGKPKGVIIQHQAIINTLLWRKEYYKFDVKDNILQIPTFTFDSSVEDIFTSLLSGSRLVLSKQEHLLDMAFLTKILESSRITHFLITPALYKIFLRDIFKSLKDLKIVTVAGDSFSEVLVIDHFRKLPAVRLFNEYGPTENSVCSTVYEFNAENTTVLIGKPIANVCCYILGRQRQLNPIGIPGELCVSGPGLSPGYLNNPTLIVEKFIDNPFSPGNKLYRTGDLARWHPGGNIEFLGRIDHQVKVRGFRIELEEIEAQLLRHQYIRDAVAIVREDEKGDPQLCAYIVSAKDIGSDAIREYLSLHLPYYMVPTFVTPITKIPLTANGKIDRRALPEPSLGGHKNYKPPQNNLQEKLASLWSRELGIAKEDIGIETSFFDLGGDSLKATTLVAKIHKECSAQIPLIELFRTPTISGLSAIIRKSAENRLIEILPAGFKEHYPLSPAQKRLYVAQHIELENTGYNIPIVMVLTGSIDRRRLEKAFNKLIQQHESLRTSFKIIDREPVQKIHGDVEFTLDYFTANTQEAEEKIVNAFVRPFDLSRAPLLRSGLIESPTRGRHILVVDMHHIISDAFSQQVLIADFAALYAGRELPPLTLQYKDYSEWLAREAEEKLKNQEQFWLEQFRNYLPQGDLPTNYTRPAMQSYEGDETSFELSVEETTVLREIARREGTTLYTILLAAYYMFLARITNREDIVVGTVTAGRRHADLERIIGMFVNTLALRSYPSGQKKFITFLREVKGQVLAAFDNQDYQFEDLVDLVGWQRVPNRNPLFDAVFSMDNITFSAGSSSAPQVSLEGVAVSPYRYKSKTSKFDLMLMGVEKDVRVFFVMRFCTRLFSLETIQRFTGYYREVLAAVAADPAKTIAEIRIGGEENRLGREDTIKLEADFEYSPPHAT